jgi:hypothetical protein
VLTCDAVDVAMSDAAWARFTPWLVLSVVVLGVACALFSLTYRLPKEGDPATFAKRTETVQYGSNWVTQACRRHPGAGSSPRKR